MSAGAGAGWEERSTERTPAWLLRLYDGRCARLILFFAQSRRMTPPGARRWVLWVGGMAGSDMPAFTAVLVAGEQARAGEPPFAAAERQLVAWGLLPPPTL